jgi:hypothetical protein
MNAVQPEAVQRVPRVRPCVRSCIPSRVCAGVLVVGIALPASGLEPSLLTGNYRAVRPAVHNRPTRANLPMRARHLSSSLCWKKPGLFARQSIHV